jgi:flagellin-specific chaperone FliS
MIPKSQRVNRPKPFEVSTERQSQILAMLANGTRARFQSLQAGFRVNDGNEPGPGNTITIQEKIWLVQRKLAQMINNFDLIIDTPDQFEQRRAAFESENIRKQNERLERWMDIICQHIHYDPDTEEMSVDRIAMKKSLINIANEAISLTSLSD